MATIYELLDLPKTYTCWGNCGQGTRAHVAPGHDPAFSKALLEHLVGKGYDDVLRDIAEQIYNGDLPSPCG